ncbi:MAG: hypothetical protein PHR47_00695 [Candidatus Pacebacteria bacterium]|nr:hypothetical protein [Candidatus Paceibacterota bacterium]
MEKILMSKALRINAKSRTVNYKNFGDVCRIAYGNSGYSKNQVKYARSLVVFMAKHPIEIVEAYYLVYRDKTLSKLLFKLIKTKMKIINEEDWEVINDWTNKMGLENLKEKIFEQDSQL